MRQILTVKHGSFVRCNGLVLSADVHLKHADVLEYHAAPGHDGLSFSLSCPRVQLCLEASLPSLVSPFDENCDATLLLQHPQIARDLSDNAEWSFVRIPEGLDLHPATFEALHLQHEIEHSVPTLLELYVDGATSADLSAWSVVAVAVTPTGRIFSWMHLRHDANQPLPSRLGGCAATLQHRCRIVCNDRCYGVCTVCTTGLCSLCSPRSCA